MPSLAATVRRPLIVTLLVVVIAGLAASAVSAVTPGTIAVADVPDDTSAGVPRVVEILPLRGGFVDPPVSAQIRDVLDLAAAEGSELVVLQYSSTGGMSLDLDDLLGRIEASPVPVAVLVGPAGRGAAAPGAAGLVWLAAHIRAIATDATVGPLDPADLARGDGSGPTAARVEQYLDAADAQVGLREWLLTEAVPADALEDAGAVTLTAQGLEPLLVELDGTTVTTATNERRLMLRGEGLEVRFHSLGLVRRLLHAATTAPFIYLLVVIGLGMLLFEVFQPGFGVAGLAGVVTVAIGVFGLTVLPVTWWAVALVVLGLILYALDTAIAGFGPVTLLATGAFAFGSLNFYAPATLALPVWLVAVATITVLMFFVFVMTTVLRAQAGPDGVAVDDLIGNVGVVRSVLNPEGHVFVDGALWRARWTGDSKRAKVGTPVRVHAVDGPVVLVDAFEAGSTIASATSTAGSPPLRDGRDRSGGVDPAS